MAKARQTGDTSGERRTAPEASSDLDGIEAIVDKTKHAPLERSQRLVGSDGVPSSALAPIAPRRGELNQRSMLSDSRFECGWSVGIEVYLMSVAVEKSPLMAR